MGAFMDMWKNCMEPNVTSLTDMINEIILHMNKAINLEMELKKRLSEEDFTLYRKIAGQRLIVSECYKYNSFKQGFIMGKNFAKEMEDFENTDFVKEINEEIKKLKEKY